jgi:hypothetical protein
MTTESARREPNLMMLREAIFAPATFNDAERTVEVVFTTGADVTRRDYWTGETWIERLEVTESAVDLTRLNSGAPVLDAHNAYELRAVIGVVERAWIAGGEGRALLRFSDREDVRPIVEDVRSGILRNISAGYWVERWDETEASASGPKIRVAKRWLPGELSLVPVPADAGAQVRASDRAPSRAAELPNSTRAQGAHSQEVRMDVEHPGVTAPDLEAARREAREAETTRVREITAACRALGLDAEAQALIDGGVTVAEAQRRLIARVAERPQPQPSPAHVQVIRDEGDTLRTAIEGALTARLTHAPVDGPAREFRGATLIDMGIRLLDQRGVSTRGWSRSEIAQVMLGLPAMGRNMQTTSDFAALLANVQSKRLLASYAASARTFTAWTARRALPDFKTTQIVEMGAAPTMLALAEGGTIQLGAIQDAGETYSLVRYARNVSLSYPAIVNDDLGGFDRIPAAFATSVANLENQTVYDILANNGNMSDGLALFVAGHGNTAAGAMDVAGVTAARSQILRQTDPTGQRIMVMPSVIITPVELAGTARALFSATVVPAGPAITQVNPWQGSFTLVETNFLADINDYFVTVAAGSGYEAVEVGYEAGAEGPQLTSYTDANVDGVVFSCRHSFGAKAATWRTIARVTA